MTVLFVGGIIIQSLIKGNDMKKEQLKTSKSIDNSTQSKVGNKLCTKIKAAFIPEKKGLKHRLLLMVIFAVLISVYVFMFIPRTQFVGVSSSAIVGDSNEILAGQEVSQVIQVQDGTIKGMQVYFNTYERINRAEYTATVSDSSGNIVATNVFNADKLPMEGVFGIPMPNTQVVAGDTLTLTISSQDATEEDSLGVYLQSEEGVALAQAGEEALNGSLMVDVGYDGVSDDIIAITTVLIILICLAILFWSNKLHVNVFILVLIFGVLFSLITPIMDTPDEQQHVATAFLVADGNFVTDAIAGGQTTVSYNTVAQNLLNTLTNNTLQGVPISEEMMTSTWGSGVFFLWYMPQVFGNWIAKLFGGDLMAYFYAGRIFNAIVYAIFAYFAVKKAPKFKIFMGVLALMPMTLMISGSYNSDAIIYGISLLMGAYFIDMYFNDTYKISWKHMGIFALITSIVIMKKYTLGALALLPFFIPSSRYENKKVKIIGSIIIVGVAALAAVWQVKFMTSLSGGSSALTGDTINMQGANTGQQIGFMLSDPSGAASIMYRSIMRDAGLNFAQLFNLGQLTYSTYEIFIYIYIAFLAVVAFAYSRYRSEGQQMMTITKVSLLNRFMICMVMLATIVLTYMALYLTWTPVGAGAVEGVQGRYFTFMFFLLPFLGQNVWPTIKKDALERALRNILFVAVVIAAITLLTTVLHYY